jgi:hypothetical protein
MRIRAWLAEPEYAYVVIIDEAGQASLVGADPQQYYDYGVERRRVELPTDPEDWWRVVGETGTVTMILPAAGQPVADPEQLAARIVAVGPAPSVDECTIWTVANGSPIGLAATRRGPDSRPPVTVEPGLLEKLYSTFGAEFVCVEAIAYRQQAVVSSAPVRQP